MIERQIRKTINLKIKLEILDKNYYSNLIDLLNRSNIPTNFKDLEAMTAIGIHDGISQSVKKQIDIIAQVINMYRETRRKQIAGRFN